jgi:predicted metal-dependent hydrolase
VDITVRKPRFELPEVLDPVFIRGEPEESYANVALSILLPHLEPYLIRAMRAARPRVKDAALAKDLDAFCGQEGQHYRMHAELNAALVRGGARGFEALERELAEDYRRFEAERPLRFNLAYAEGFEALTTATSLVFEAEDRSKWHPAALDVFTWHVVEELEHRTVAFEVYDHVVGSYPYRAAVGAFAQWHLLRFVVRGMEAMLAADPRTATEFGGAAGRKAREPRLNALLTRKVLPRLWKTYHPRYSPRAIEMPASMLALADHYSAQSVLLRR